MKETHIRKSAENLQALTGLRFFAAFMIVLHHVQGNFGVPHDFTSLPLDSGVSFFFVLSGFILAHRYPILPDRKSVEKFFVARVARIWPSHVVCLIAAAVFVGDPTGIQSGVGYAIRFIANLFLVHAWYPDFRLIFSFNSVSWSISTEMFFYLMYPLIIAGFSRNWPWKITVSFGSLAALVAVSVFLGLGPFDGNMDGTLNATALVYINPLARIFEFALGVAACFLWKKIRMHMPSNVALSTLLEIIALLAIALFVDIRGAIGGAATSYIGWGATEWIGHSSLCFVAALLIIVIAQGCGVLAKTVALKPIVFLGEISFAMYLCHQIILNLMDLHLVPLGTISGPVLFAAYLATVGAASSLLWLFELYAKGQILDWYSGRRFIKATA